MAMSAPVFKALRPVPGSLRLICVRWVLSILAVLPGIATGKAALSESVGVRPWFAEAPDPLPLPQFFGMMEEIGSAVPVMLVGVLFVWLFNQLLTAAAVEILAASSARGRVRLWRTMIDTGGRHFLAYLRVSLVALLSLALGGRILFFVFDQLNERGVIEGWTGETTMYHLPLARAAMLLAWAGLVGICAWWSRVIVVRGGRRYLRRVLLLVPRVIWRYPVQGLLVHWLAGVASLFLGAVVLVAWRQTPGLALGWLACWLGLLVLQSVVWHWRVRTLSLIWSEPSLDDMRTKPDAPWGLFRRLRNRFRRTAGGEIT